MKCIRDMDRASAESAAFLVDMTIRCLLQLDENRLKIGLNQKLIDLVDLDSPLTANSLKFAKEWLDKGDYDFARAWIKTAVDNWHNLYGNLLPK